MPKKIKTKSKNNKIYKLYFWEKEREYRIYEREKSDKIKEGKLINKFEEKNKAIKAFREI